MSDPRSRFERWWGSGVIWQMALVASGLGMLYYTRIQALNSEATGREALGKIQDEAKANFQKLDETLRVTNDRLVKLEASQQMAKQETAIQSLQVKIAELESKYKAPEEQTRLRSLDEHLGLGDGIWRGQLGGAAPGDRVIPPLDLSPSSPLSKKFDFLDNKDKQSLHEILDGIKGPPTSSFAFQNPPKFEWKTIPPAKPETVPERVASTVRTYWFLILILFAALFGRKR